MTCPRVCSSFSKEEVERLSNISYVLCEAGRRDQFRLFLRDCQLEQCESTLDFWEEIDEISKSDGSIDQIKEKVGNLIRHVNDGKVNLDLSHIKKLKKCEKYEDITKIKQKLEIIKGYVVDNLTESHDLYKARLSKGH